MVLVCGVKVFVMFVLVCGIVFHLSCAFFVGCMMYWLALRYGKALHGTRPESLLQDFIFRIYSSLILANILICEFLF